MTTKSSQKLVVQSIRIVGVLVLTFLFLALLGAFVTKFLPDVDIQRWFYDTRWIWFFVRLALYAFVLSIVYAIQKRNPTAMPKMAKVLVVSILIFAEGISQISLA